MNCGKCVTGVTPFLNRVSGINWKVDTADPNHILTVETDSATEEDIIKAVKKAGYEIEKV